MEVSHLIRSSAGSHRWRARLVACKKSRTIFLLHFACASEFTTFFERVCRRWASPARPDKNMGNAESMDAQLTDFRARGSKPPKLPMPDPAELEERFAIALVSLDYYILCCNFQKKAYRCNCIMCTTSMGAGSPRQHTRLYCVGLAVCNPLMLFARA